jgi:hypothetical protein
LTRATTNTIRAGPRAAVREEDLLLSHTTPMGVAKSAVLRAEYLVTAEDV